MRIAMIADLHGNMPALRAVEESLALQRVDTLYCLGDIVGKGPSSIETMEWALAHCDVVLGGNWDYNIAGIAYPGLEWYAEQLGEARLDILRALPEEHRFTFCGRRVRLLHGRPTIDEALNADSPIEQRLELFDTPDGYRPQMVGIADVHRPFYEHIGTAGILFNTGSVGNPLGDQPYATYIILDGEMGETVCPMQWTVVQLPYDRDQAVRDAEAMDGMPSKAAFINEVRTGRYSR